jgi:hypothetical protein
MEISMTKSGSRGNAMFKGISRAGCRASLSDNVLKTSSIYRNAVLQPLSKFLEGWTVFVFV